MSIGRKTNIGGTAKLGQNILVHNYENDKNPMFSKIIEKGKTIKLNPLKLSYVKTYIKRITLKL